MPNSYPKAFYTMSYQEFMDLWKDTQDYTDFMSEASQLAEAAGVSAYLELYFKVIYERWHEYEIAGETIYEQADFIKSTFYEEYTYHFQQIKKYYVENIANEPTLMDMLTRSIVTSGTSTNTNVHTGTFSNTRDSEVKDIHVDLPNKVIDPADVYAYPSTADKTNEDTTNSGSDSYTKTDNGATENSVENTDKSKYYEMLERSMRAIRNLMKDMAEDYSDCFIHIY